MKQWWITLTRKKCSWERLEEKVWMLKGRRKNSKQDECKTLLNPVTGSLPRQWRTTRKQLHHCNGLRQCFCSYGSIPFPLRTTAHYPPQSSWLLLPRAWLDAQVRSCSAHSWTVYPHFPNSSVLFQLWKCPSLPQRSKWSCYYWRLLCSPAQDLPKNAANQAGLTIPFQALPHQQAGMALVHPALRRLI